MSDRRPRLDGLSSLRFFAAVGIFFFHAFAMKSFGWAPQWAQHLAELGYIGVSFFLVLSGFVLVYGFAGRPIEKWGFWRSRLARVYPAYLFSLLFVGTFFFYAIFMLDIPELAWFKAHPLATTLLCLTLLQAWVPPAALGWNAPGWALSVFWFYYLIFPGVLRWAERRKTQVLWTVAGVAWIAAVGLSIAYVIVKPDHVQYANPYHINLFWLNALKFNPAVRLPEFLLGVALGFQVIRSERWKRYGVQMVLGGVVLLAVLIAVRPLVPYPVMHTGLAAPAFLLLIWGVAAKPKLTALLETKPFVILGDVSLSFYLLHSNILGMMVYAGGGIPRVSPSITFFALFVSIVASVVVYMVIEIPARRWLEGKPRTQAGAVAA